VSGRGLIVSAPGSGSGKTLVTLGLLRALSRRAGQGTPVRGAKSGPDYIDPRFHEAACGAPCLNLDAWAMPPDRLAARAAGEGLLVIEGAMGLFDGAPPDGRGATADLARTLNLPVLLVVDAAKMAHSVAPLVRGFASHNRAVRVAGVILNRVGSPRHRAMLEAALAPLRLPVLGALPRDPALALPERHLGLVQAGEHPALEAFLESAADTLESHADLPAIAALAAPLAAEPAPPPPGPFAAPGKRIAIARDEAFAFTYAHHLHDWQAAGATLLPFSPLANDPVPQADLVLLPGGYPELHAGRLAANRRFLDSLRDAAEAGRTDIYGECGGYMVLGRGLTDASGTRHEMAGLLALETSFAERRLHLGYRHVTGPAGHWLEGRHAAHEFHYATTLEASGTPLFTARDAEGSALAPMGLREGRVCGSFAHLIEAAP